jgi:hypothetical protein
MDNPLKSDEFTPIFTRMLQKPAITRKGDDYYGLFFICYVSGVPVFL